jgi:hypothetical protein
MAGIRGAVAPPQLSFADNRSIGDMDQQTGKAPPPRLPRARRKRIGELLLVAALLALLDFLLPLGLSAIRALGLFLGLAWVWVGREILRGRAPRRPGMLRWGAESVALAGLLSLLLWLVFAWSPVRAIAFFATCSIAGLAAGRWRRRTPATSRGTRDHV